MLQLCPLLVVATLVAAPLPARAELSIELAPAASNPASPRMGDRLAFHTVIRNDGAQPVKGVIAWLSLVQVDPGKERPVDLEDWSAHKVVTAASLPPGGTIETDWPMRLIQSGAYRIVISATSRSHGHLWASNFVPMQVRPKPVVESARVMPIAFGIPALIAAALLVRRWRR